MRGLFSCESEPLTKEELDSLNRITDIFSEAAASTINTAFPQTNSNIPTTNGLYGSTYTPGSGPGQNISNIQRFAGGINNAIGTTGAILSTTVDAAGNIITKSLDSVGNVVTTTTDTAGNIISQTVGAAGNLLTGTANTLSNTAQNIGGDVGSTLKSGASGVSSLGKDAISGTAGLLKNVGSNLTNALTSGNKGQMIAGQPAGGQMIAGQPAGGQMVGGQMVGGPVAANQRNMGVDYYSYYGALPAKTASNYQPTTAQFCAFGK